MRELCIIMHNNVFATRYHDTPFGIHAGCISNGSSSSQVFNEIPWI